MKLTNSDKTLLKSWGYEEKDFAQIEEATQKTDYILNNKKISQKEALGKLGRKEYLSGISRSAFHFTAMRNGILFDSSKLFKVKISGKGRNYL